MSLLIVVLAGFVHVSYVVFLASTERGGDPIYSSLAMSLLKCVFLVLFFGLWKFYCAQWTRLSKRSLLRLIVEKIWVPFISILLVTEPSYFIGAHRDMGVMITAMVLFVVLMDWDWSIHRAVVSLAERHGVESDVRKLYTHYPPQTRSDMLPMDLFFLAFTVVMIIKKLT